MVNLLPYTKWIVIITLTFPLKECFARPACLEEGVRSPQQEAKHPPQLILAPKEELYSKSKENNSPSCKDLSSTAHTRKLDQWLTLIWSGLQSSFT